MSKPDLFAVTGKPVAHSLSPDIFKLLFAASGLNAFYTRLAADSAREALQTARAIGLRGLNVTSPFKEEMSSLVDGLDEHASRIGAVNCLTIGGPEPGLAAESESVPKKASEAGKRRTQRADSEGRPAVTITGYNTDFIGLIGTLNSLGVDPIGRAVLILGTGGASRAAAYGLVGAGAARVILAGRSPERARDTARVLRCDWVPFADAGALLNDVDLCVSCLPFPASRVLPDPPLNGCLIVDAHYASARNTTEAGSRNPSANPSAALRWLFHQAIPSFEILTGINISTRLRQEILERLLTLKQRSKRHIALVGFMGTGKTTVGRQLARLTGCEFIDTDEAVEAAAGARIPEIFALRGEGSFRSLERSAIAKLASAGSGRKVISVGGGAVLDEESCRILAENCRVVWLWTPAAAAISRVDIATRPVLDPGRPLESAEAALAARLPLYGSVSDLIVNSGDAGPLEVARRIKDEMDPTLRG